jgi:hypothetical protein
LNGSGVTRPKEEVKVEAVEEQEFDALAVRKDEVVVSCTVEGWERCC